MKYVISHFPATFSLRSMLHSLSLNHKSHVMVASPPTKNSAATSQVVLTLSTLKGVEQYLPPSLQAKWTSFLLMSKTSLIMAFYPENWNCFQLEDGRERSSAVADVLVDDRLGYCPPVLDSTIDH